jgi:hypothetical protein
MTIRAQRSLAAGAGWRRMAILCGCGLLALVLAGHRLAARQVIAPSAEQLRYQLIGNEPVAGPDGRALVKGWSVIVFKDRKAGECYVAFTRGEAIAVSQPSACPE